VGMTSILIEALSVLLLLFSVITAGHAMLNKRDPRAGFVWVFMSLFSIPLLGPCLYWIFGVNRIRTHARKLYRLGHWNHESKIEKGNWSYRLPRNRTYFQGVYRGILNVSDKVSRRPLLVGNRIEILHNGEEAYPAMLKAIRQAKKFIYLCTYIFDNDAIGRRFVDALGAARKRGVEVRVLIDAFGERYSFFSPIGSLLEKTRIRMARFLPLNFSLNTLHLNLRNHRKLLVIDGHTGFTGGVNIRQKYLEGGVGGVGEIQDIHFKIKGPVIWELQEAFLEDWYFATQESLPWDAYTPKPLPGDSICRIITGGPNEDFEKVNLILMGALAWAKKRIRIMTPYFVPDRVLISAINTAALRGVCVDVILPSVNNLPFVAWAGRAVLWEMLQHGVKFYYRPPPFSHGKLFVADDTYSIIGSSNWDARSLRLNFELDVEVYDTKFAMQLSHYFDKVKSHSRAITLKEVESDPLIHQLRNSFFKLFSPYL
jgi:cardiolipin synthase A/B